MWIFGRPASLHVFFLTGKRVIEHSKKAGHGKSKLEVNPYNTELNIVSISLPRGHQAV
jgi:hypothetical protein